MTPNALSVFRRDLGRLARVSKAWIIIVGVIVTPSLYAWFNIVAFWDPYSHTQNVSVAIVNQDEGATSELTGDIDVGAELVGELEKNDQLGWEFVDEDEAMDAVRSGGAMRRSSSPKTSAATSSASPPASSNNPSSSTS